MSTVDPAAERPRGAAAGRGRGPSRIGAAVGLPLFAGVWILFGLGLADMAVFPLGDLYLTDDTRPANDLPGLLWAVFLAVFITPLAGGAVRPGPAVLSAVAGLGAAAGFLFGAREFWVEPPAPGVFTDAAGTAAGEWGAGAWIAWTARYWVPAVLVVLAVLRAGVSLRLARLRGRRAERIRTVIATGHRTRGVVTGAEETGIEIRNRPCVRFVVRFTDHAGVDRWVTKLADFDRTAPPRAGDPVTVWFDPADPGDERSIPVSLTMADDAGTAPAADFRTIV
ncbi:DUF3592 domain-containing protein [Streptomyces sp. CAU 1734]|uniref:DUF3592 domain-containing protein n=1 Tax=Streptomyces sp. CAU 1734 TaxID=3140360 RepID=UPI00325FFC05